MRVALHSTSEPQGGKQGIPMKEWPGGEGEVQGGKGVSTQEGAWLRGLESSRERRGPMQTTEPSTRGQTYLHRAGGGDSGRWCSYGGIGSIRKHSRIAGARFFTVREQNVQHREGGC